MKEKICILGSIHPILGIDSIHTRVNHQAIQCYHCLVLLKFFLHQPPQCCFWAPTCTTLKPSLKSVLCGIWTTQTIHWTFAVAFKTCLMPEDVLLFFFHQISSSFSSDTILIIVLLWNIPTYSSIGLKGINGTMPGWKFVSVLHWKYGWDKKR